MLLGGDPLPYTDNLRRPLAFRSFMLILKVNFGYYEPIRTGSTRKRNFDELRIIRSLGIKIKIVRYSTSSPERVMRLEDNESGERMITDVNQMPEILWDLFGSAGSKYSFLTITRLKPLLIKDNEKKEWQINTDKLKDILKHPQVRIDHGLIAFTRVECLYDACTDELQRHLDDGYRIIACIPQVAQRRPDYILGKENG